MHFKHRVRLIEHAYNVLGEAHTCWEIVY